MNSWRIKIYVICFLCFILAACGDSDSSSENTVASCTEVTCDVSEDTESTTDESVDTDDAVTDETGSGTTTDETDSDTGTGLDMESDTDSDSDSDENSDVNSDTDADSEDQTEVDSDDADETPSGALDEPVIENDDVSEGGTMTFTDIGETGWYPSRRDPSSGQCDALDTDSCCMTEYDITSDELSPWDEELIMSLRGPLLLERYVVYQPDDEDYQDSWLRVSVWDRQDSTLTDGVVFGEDGVEESGFDGGIGSSCIVDVMNSDTFNCTTGSVPYCEGGIKYTGWSGSKLFVLLAKMPRAGDDSLTGVEDCGTSSSGWYDAPWIGLSNGELVRSGKFSSCNCYAKDPDEWWLADGCGQFNAFEVVNDNNEYANFELFSTNFFAYHGYVGDGPCGDNCDVSELATTVDLVNTSNSEAATEGAVASPDSGPGYAFRRPEEGYRYFLILLDASNRSVQLAMVHPEGIPAELSELLPGVPDWVSRETIDSVLELGLPAN